MITIMPFRGKNIDVWDSVVHDPYKRIAGQFFPIKSTCSILKKEKSGRKTGVANRIKILLNQYDRDLIDLAVSPYETGDTLGFFFQEWTLSVFKRTQVHCPKPFLNNKANEIFCSRVVNVLKRLLVLEV